MAKLSRSRPAIAVVIVTLFMGFACSPGIYKKEVDAFSQGVKAAVDTFDTLAKEDIKRDQQSLEEALAKDLTGVEVSDVCFEMTMELQKQAACFAAWARHRAGQGIMPSWCDEPKGFYELPRIRAEECQLGVVDAKGKIDPQRVKASPVFKKTAVMASKLSDYASALSAITSSKDIEELQSAFSDAKTSITGVAGHYKDLTGKEVPEAQAIGPITEMIGIAAVKTMEWRRFNVLKATVNNADPVVTAAAMRLSMNAMPLVLMIRIRPAQERLQRASEVFNSKFLTKENYPAKMREIIEAHAEYIQLFENDISSTFKTMAKAHVALKDALNDPERQAEPMQTEIKLFLEKAKSVRDALVEESGK